VAFADGSQNNDELTDFPYQIPRVDERPGRIVSATKEDTNITSVPQPTKAAMVSQELVIAIDGQSVSPLAIPTLDDPRVPQ
jgi:hypothetical protein